jgi:hypothetical protein
VTLTFLSPISLSMARVHGASICVTEMAGVGAADVGTGVTLDRVGVIVDEAPGVAVGAGEVQEIKAKVRAIDKAATLGLRTLRSVALERDGGGRRPS